MLMVCLSVLYVDPAAFHSGSGGSTCPEEERRVGRGWEQEEVSTVLNGGLQAEGEAGDCIRDLCSQCQFEYSDVMVACESVLWSVWTCAQAHVLKHKHVMCMYVHTF